MDAEKGCILKAEMAKKNLHTKRGLSNDHVFPNSQLQVNNLTNTYLSNSYMPYPSMNGIQPNGYEANSTFVSGTTKRMVNMQKENPDVFFLNNPAHLPSDLLTNQEYPFDTGYSPSSVVLAKPALKKLNSNASSASSSNLHDTNSQSFNNRFDNTFSSHPGLMERSNSWSSTRSDRSSACIMNDRDGRNDMVCGLVRSSSIGSNVSFADKSLLKSGEETNSSYGYLTPPPGCAERGFNSALYPSESLLPNRLLASPINLPSGIIAGLTSGSVVLDPIASLVPCPHPLGGPEGNHINNFVYITNLPINFNEEDIRSFFKIFPGYKGFGIRHRASGPTCFVEFEDAGYAATALHELDSFQFGNKTFNHRQSALRIPLALRSTGNSNLIN